MNPKITKNILLYTLLAAAIFPRIALATEHANIGESLSGYFSRDGNNASPSETTRNNIYIKFFEDRWVVMLFIPYPYATSVESSTIERAFQEAKKKTSGSAYLRGKFDQLEEFATVQIERYGYLEDRIVFECGSLSPCTIKTGDDYLDLIKPGMINEHIIRYNHVKAE
jgi:hypothetical protein